MDDIQFILDQLEEIDFKLTEWEVNFIDSISHQVSHGRKLTDNQLEKLNSIWDKHS